MEVESSEMADTTLAVNGIVLRKVAAFSTAEILARKK